MNCKRTTIALVLAGLAAALLPQGAAAGAGKNARVAGHQRDARAQPGYRDVRGRAEKAHRRQDRSRDLSSAQLFRDRDIPKALRQNAIEMGIPGTWQLDGVEPNTAIQTLPMFYGVQADIVHKIIDGKLGQFINKRMEERLKVKILGKWMDLGFQHFYSVSKPVTSTTTSRA